MDQTFLLLWFHTLGMDSRGLQHNNIEEQQFKRDLQQDGCKLQHRTSSPINFKSFLQSAALKDAEEAGELHKTQADVPPCAIGISFRRD